MVRAIELFCQKRAAISNRAITPFDHLRYPLQLIGRTSSIMLKNKCSVELHNVCRAIGQRRVVHTKFRIACFRPTVAPHSDRVGCYA